MAATKHKRPTVRSFERASRIQALLAAGFIRSPDEIPADAIPAQPQFVELCRLSLRVRTRKRPPYFHDQPFTCADCKQQFTWTADEQRFWYEQLRGPIYSEATRCQACRKKRKGNLRHEPTPKSRNA